MTAIYKIESITFPERQYFGSAVNYNSRVNEHLCDLRHGRHNRKLQNHYNEYGESDLKFSPVLTGCSREDLTFIEDIFIHPLPYFNICPKAGSCLGVKHSEETCKKHSEISIRLGLKPPSNKGKSTGKGISRNKGYKHTEEFKLNCKIRMLEIKPTYLHSFKKGHIPANKGKHYSEEIKIRMRKPKSEEAKLNMSKARLGKPSSMKGKHHSEEAKLNMSKAHLNLSQESRDNMSKAGKLKFQNGYIHPMQGKHHSEETCLNFSKIRKGKPSGRKGKHYNKETRKYE